MSKFSPISLEGTVVGLLFSKTGVEIREAVAEKIGTLANEVTELKESIQDVDEFLESKEDELEELNVLYSERHGEKDAQSRPFRRQIDEVQKAWGDKEFEFNRETERLVGEKAVVFGECFKDFSERFAEIDELADEVEDMNPVMLLQAAGASMDSLSLTGSTSGTRTMGSMRRVADTNPCSEVSLLPTEQDNAAARLATLRGKVITYRNKIALIKGRIDMLKDEVDELRLVSRHLKDEREYTLDLDRLSALGFRWRN